MPGPHGDSSAAPTDEKFMRLALREAARGAGQTSPNPGVGAVIVRQGRVLARGFHHAAGAPHAEIEALRALKKPALARGATLYVSLEPCSTHGRTPPCTDAILEAGLARVVVGATDPNPRHAGRGLSLLTAAGVDVRAGVLEEPCRHMNRAFNHWITTGRPWVIAKAALTLDGRLTRPPGEDRWLSSARARAHAHRLRARVDAILIGANTLRTDNPRLTVRGTPNPTGRQPWRVVLTRGRNILPMDAHLFTDEWKERTLIFRDRPLDQVLIELGGRDITSVLIEGGGEVLGHAFEAGLVHEVQFYFTPLIAGGPHAILAGSASASAVLAGLCNSTWERLGPDVVVTAEMTRQGT